MHSVDLTSCVKQSFLGGYKLKEVTTFKQITTNHSRFQKHYKEIVKSIEQDAQARQQLSEENDRLKDALEQAESNIRQYKDWNHELTSNFNNSNSLLQEERDLSVKQKAEYDALVQRLSDLEVKAAQDCDKALENERKMEAELQQLKVLFCLVDL